MSKSEIIVKFPESVNCIRIESQDDLVSSYEKSGKQIPPFIVFVPYFEIDGKGYYVFPHKQEQDE